MSKYLVTGTAGWLGNRLLMALSGTIPELEHLAAEKEVERNPLSGATGGQSSDCGKNPSQDQSISWRYQGLELAERIL